MSASRRRRERAAIEALWLLTSDTHGTRLAVDQLTTGMPCVCCGGAPFAQPDPAYACPLCSGRGALRPRRDGDLERAADQNAVAWRNEELTFVAGKGGAGGSAQGQGDVSVYTGIDVGQGRAGNGAPGRVILSWSEAPPQPDAPMQASASFKLPDGAQAIAITGVGGGGGSPCPKNAKLLQRNHGR